MKTLFLIYTLLLLTSVNFAQGILEIKHPNLQLKDLKADDQPQTQIFTVTNTGNQPIIITRVVSMSSLFKTNWTREPLAPGKKGEIRITFTPKQLQETFNYTIMVHSNASSKATELKISGNLVDNPAKPTLLYKYTLAGIKFKASNINFGKIYTWQTVSDTTYYINTRKEPITLAPQQKPAHLDIVFEPATTAPGKRGAMIITYNAPKKNDFGYSYESLTLNVNGEKDYRNRLTITANLAEDFSKLPPKELANAPIAAFEQKEVSFGEIRQGEKANCNFILKNTGKSPLFIRKTKASCGCTAITLGDKAIQPGQSTTIRATFNSAGKSGRQYKTITVITNDPQHPETELTVSGNVKSK